jgi:adenosine deaminase/aminodeoxyfutalosine deaminase
VSTWHALPKAELHLHLEGSIEPATLMELDPSLTPEEIAARYRFANFTEFIESYKWVTNYLAGPAEFALAARRLLERLAGENVSYAEITLSAGVVLFRGRDLAAIWEAVCEEVRRSPVRTLWLFDAVRQFGPEAAMRVAEFATARIDEGIAAFGIGGDERLAPAEWFHDVFRFARQSGLRVTAHAGETSGPESVWAALKLGAERIGHGIGSIHDPVLLRYLREREIPLEICLTSNLATGAVASWDEHPIRRLYDAGVPIVLGSDDPAMFHTTLTREFELAASRFGFSEEELRGIAANGFRYAFDHPRRVISGSANSFGSAE